jgi:hypothetical protein
MGMNKLPRLEKSEVASVITSSDATGEKKLFCGKNLIGPPSSPADYLRAAGRNKRSTAPVTTRRGTNRWANTWTFPAT